MDHEKLVAIQTLFPIIAVVVALPFVGWVLTTWMRIKNGYPLDVPWGQTAAYPKKDEETVERVRLLTTENAHLRAELGSIKDRLATVERIVTDDSRKLTREIEALRGPVN